MVLDAKCTEGVIPIVPTDIDYNITQLERVNEGIASTNVIAVAQILTSANDAQLGAMNEHGLSDEIPPQLGGH